MNDNFHVYKNIYPHERKIKERFNDFYGTVFVALVTDEFYEKASALEIDQLTYF